MESSEANGRQERPVEATVMCPTTDMIGAIASEVKHAIALGKPVEYGIARGLEWGCWEPVFRSARTDEDHARQLLKLAQFSDAPNSTSWGAGMLVADIAISKDETMSVYVHKDALAHNTLITLPPEPEDHNGA